MAEEAPCCAALEFAQALQKIAGHPFGPKPVLTAASMRRIADEALRKWDWPITSPRRADPEKPTGPVLPFLH